MSETIESMHYPIELWEIDGVHYRVNNLTHVVECLRDGSWRPSCAPFEDWQRFRFSKRELARCWRGMTVAAADESWDRHADDAFTHDSGCNK